jgi:signal transduction histidine kinase
MGRVGAALRQREAAVGVVVALIVVLGAVLGVGESKRARDHSARASAAEELAFATATVDADLASVVEDATRLAARVAATGSLAPGLATTTSPVAGGVEFVRVTTTTSGAHELVPQGGAGLTADTLAPAVPALDLARDIAVPRGLPALSLSTGGERPFIAAPAFRMDPTGFPPQVLTTDQRRADLVGYVLIGVDTAALATRAQRSGTTVLVRAATASATPLATSDASASTTLSAVGQGWDVAAVVGSPATLTGGELGVVVAALLLAAGLVAGGLAAAVRRRTALADAESALVRLRLLTSLAPLLQETLDLGLVLPEIATRLRDELDLAGIAFAAPDASAGFRDIYQLGTVDPVAPTADLQPSLLAGESAAIVMHRGGRNVGMLRVKPRRAMTTDEVDALQGAAELATAAIVSGQLFEQQDEAMRRLREVDELKTAFLSTASHELRTPVTAIKGFATLLDGSWDGESSDEDQRIYAARILANAKSLDSLLQDLLDFSRLERGRLLTRAMPVELVDVVADVLERLSVLFKEHELVRELSPTPLVLADPAGLERILTNLLSNAVHYAPPGTTVTVRTTSTGDGAELVVDDQGPGVPAAERNKVFSRFFRGAGDAVVRTRGTGIGLAVVKEYVDQLGGAVSVESAPGGGARFRVWLAAAEPREEAT